MMIENKNSKLDKGLKLIVKSSAIIFIGVFLSKFLTYVYRIIIARYFGPEIYGLYSLASIVLGLFVILSSIGLTEGLVRFVCFYRGRGQINRIRYLIKIVTIFVLFFSITSGVLLFLVSDLISKTFFHNENLKIFLQIFSILVPLTNISYIFLNLLRAFEKIGYYSFIWNILQNFVKLIALVLFIILGLKTNAVIFSYFLGILSMLLAAFFLCKCKLSELFVQNNLKKGDKRKLFKEIFSYSWPVMFSGLIMTIFYWVDSSLIGYFMGVADVGVYNSVTPLVGLMAFIPAMFTQLFFPLITREFSRKNLDVIRGLSKQVGKWIFILNLPLFFILIIFPTTLISLFFGEAYISASSVLIILAIGGFISSLVFLSTDLISMIGKSKLILINTIGALVLDGILNILLIPQYGLNGAAISTTFVGAILSLVFLCEVKYYLQIVPIQKKIFQIFLISLIPLSLLLFLKQYIKVSFLALIFLGFFFILSYLCLLLLTKSLDKNDFFILREIKKRVLQNKFENAF